MYVVAVSHKDKPTYPLACVKIEVNGQMRTASILFYGSDSYKIALTTAVGKLRPGYKMHGYIIPHSTPVSFPQSNALVLVWGTGIPLAMQLQQIYKFEASNSKFVIATETDEDVLYATSFQEMMPRYDQVTLTPHKNLSAQEGVQNLKQLVSDRKWQSVIVIGPIWLMKLAKHMSEYRKDIYGIQLLTGAISSDKMAMGRAIRIWLEDLSMFDDEDPADQTLAKWATYQIAQEKQAAAQAAEQKELSAEPQQASETGSSDSEK